MPNSNPNPNAQSHETFAVSGTVVGPPRWAIATDVPTLRVRAIPRGVALVRTHIALILVYTGYNVTMNQHRQHLVSNKQPTQ